MKRQILIAIALMVILLTLPACKSQTDLSSPTFTNAVVNTLLPDQPSATPEANPPVLPPTVIPGGDPVLMIFDDFSDINSGWERYNEFDRIMDYRDGIYRMWVNASNMFWVQRNEEHTDVRLEVDAALSAGPESSLYGLICRMRSFKNFYFAAVSGGGHFGIFRILKKETTMLIGGAETAHPAILVGENAVNHLRLDCIGNTLSFYANGMLLAEVQDSAFKSGDVGLTAGNYQEKGADVWFDNFYLYLP